MLLPTALELRDGNMEMELPSFLQVPLLSKLAATREDGILSAHDRGCQTGQKLHALQ